MGGVVLDTVKKQIFVVEDDEKLRRTLEAFLTASGYRVMTARDGQEALDLYFSNNQCIDLILLDGMLPKVDGFDVLRMIREYSDVPIIMLTAREAEEDQLEGLENGADNYITKPFLLRVLKAHMEVLLKRSRKGSSQVIQRGALKIETEFRKVYLNGELLATTPKEYDLLIYFLQHEQIVLPRETILDAVWGFDYEGGNRTVDTVVKQLRKKMTEEYPYIQSVYGVGYRFEVCEND
ncbi:MAG: response regulator transcription factor [Candidatus Limivivens sp.]|nr:response regulator transcription factor [Candidatus Limivivens sp.]